MGLVKVLENKAYFKRLQVRLKRRRQGKTDYQARKRLTVQDKNKYDSHKYRLIVRFTNKDVLAQIAYSRIGGDVIVASAYSHELPAFGIKIGLTNYAAAYATGLLLACRHLKSLKLGTFKGRKDEAELHNVEKQEKCCPKVVLDIGLARATVGCKAFAVMKGAADGGINIPHRESKFYGYDDESQKYDAKAHRDRIFGKHVADYMRLLKEDKESTYKKQFSHFIENGIDADNLEEIYKEVHAAIRENPYRQPNSLLKKMEWKDNKAAAILEKAAPKKVGIRVLQ